MPTQTREEMMRAHRKDRAEQRALDDTAIYNYTRRPLTDAQRAANMREGNPVITELLQPLLTFSEPPSKKTMDKRAAEILRLVRRGGTPYIHIETDFFFLQHLERYFAKRDVRTKIAPDSYALSINKAAATEAARGKVEPFAHCFTDVNGEAKELCSAPTKDDDPRDMRTITPLYKQPPAPVVPECPYHCGWHALHSIAVKRAAYFARVTIDDDYPEAVRSAGIELGEYAVSLTRAMLNAAPESDQ